MAFFFAWVDSSETVYHSGLARNDERIWGFDCQHDEGDFPTAVIDVRNPRTGLLAPGRKLWAWLSWDGGDTGGPEPLFFGRLVGVPTELDDEIIRITLRARPRDADTQLSALAEAMKVAPYWDPVWIAPERRSDPHVVLESRPALWHFDRVSHVVTASNIIQGEEAVVVFTGDSIFADSVRFQLGEQPLRRVRIEADVYWNQQAAGSIDVSSSIVDAFHDAGSTQAFTITSYTGQGLADDWPEEGDDIGGGWTAGPGELRRVDGITSKARYKNVNCKYAVAPFEDKEQDDLQVVFGGSQSFRIENNDPVVARFRLWSFIPKFACVYEASRQRHERLTFTLNADVQPIFTDSEDDESETIALSSNDVDEFIDGEGSNATRPIADLRRRQYFPTDRGLESIEYLIAVARSRILSRARAVRASAEIPFDLACQLTCRRNATLVAGILPGGSVTGKVVSYGFSFDGSTGVLTGHIEVACCAGRGNTVAGAAGDPAYVQDGYVADGYQRRTGVRIAPIGSDIYYVPPSDGPQDDGVDFLDMDAAHCVESVEVANGETVQSDVLSATFTDIAAAVDRLNDQFTAVSLVLAPVNGGPFEQTYSITVSDLMVPKTIDLEAA